MIGIGFVAVRPLSAQCTSDLVSSEAAVVQRKVELDLATSRGGGNVCPAYQAYVASLEQASNTSETCGPAQMRRRSSFPHPAAELAFHRRIVAERCS
jgi:hypothetical protein